MSGHKCARCGEYIPFATDRGGGVYICADCCGETRRLAEQAKPSRTNPIQRAEYQYHGSRLDDGEW